MTDWKSTTLTLGHSPDPDDAFMFYAMAEEQIDLRGYKFEHILQDIQTLNERATRGELHITAVSIHALAYVLHKYALLPSGASMGDGYGPMFIVDAGKGLPAEATDEERKQWLLGKRIAIPGKMTSAFLAAQIFLGKDFEYVVVPFDEIFDAVRSGKVDVGLIIHEGQITYARDGFELILDLGVWWKARTGGLPLPLGGNVVRKDIPPAVRKELSDVLYESIAYGLKHRSPAITHSMQHARGLDTALADEFIGMYVNELTLDYGDRGREAIRRFLAEAHEAGLIPHPVELEFVE
ncbi:MAG TPA: MqnA/MqnD/SBP family protein [Chthoniobacterales bacterium]|nr:MqnA/MqnD/SBP family protein [Chthoniobacterales bacterium]